LQVKDSTWLTPNGNEMSAEHWGDPNARTVGLILDGRAQTTGIRRRGSDPTILLIVNSFHEAVPFKLVEVSGGKDWERLLDTNMPDEDFEPEDRPHIAFGQTYTVTGRSLLLFKLRPMRTPRLTG
jgi:glycogen operon protein